MAARLLGIANFGRFLVAMGVSTMFVGFATSGVGVAATRYTARDCNVNPGRLGGILALASSITILTASATASVLLVFGGYIASHVYNLPSLAPAIRLSAIYLFFVALNGYQAGTAVGLGAFQETTIINATQCVVSFIVVGALTVGWGVSGAAFGMGLAAAGMWLHYKVVLTRLLSEKGVRLNYRHCTREMRMFWSFALPSAVGGVVGATGTWMTMTLLVKSPDGVREFALFNAAIIFRQCVLFAPTIMQKVLSISLSEMCGRVDPAAYRKLYNRNVAYNLVAGIAVALPLLVLKKPLLQVFGKEFVDPHGVAFYIIVFTVAEVWATSLYQAIPAAGAMWWQVAVLALWVAALVGAASLLVTPYGAKGLALSYLAAWIISVAAYYAVSRALLSNPDRQLGSNNVD